MTQMGSQVLRISRMRPIAPHCDMTVTEPSGKYTIILTINAQHRLETRNYSVAELTYEHKVVPTF